MKLAIAVAPLERRAWSWRSHEEPGPIARPSPTETMIRHHTVGLNLGQLEWLSHLPADEGAGIGVDGEGDVDEARQGADVGEVG